MNVFSKKLINLRFVLDAQAGTFDDGSNAVDITGLRVKATLAANNGPSMNQCDLEIFGLPLAVMNRLTILQNGYTQGINNQVSVSAGAEDANGNSSVSLIFSGGIQTAWVNGESQPDVSFVVQAFSELQNKFLATVATSFSGSVDAATVAASLAGQMQPPLTLQNNGVNVQLNDPHYRGDPMTQLAQLAADADFEYGTDQLGFLTLWPRGAGRNSQAVEVSPETGMIGYPAYNDRGIMVSMIYNPNVVVSGPVQIESDLTPANGTWYPFTVQHNLESETPDGEWFTHFEAQKFTGQGDQQLLPGGA